MADIHELRLQGSWIQADLSTIVSDAPPASPAAGSPFAYVTPDSVPRIVYRGSDDHIHELRLQESWIQADLSAIVSDSQPATPAASDPRAYVTPDNVARVIYRGNDSHIHELRLQESWIQADLSAIVSDSAPATPAAGNPFGYVTPDCLPRVVYRGTDNHIHELRLQGRWIQADLSAIVSDSPPATPAAGDPFAYVTPDGVPRVIYVGTDGHIHELRLQEGWIQADLSAIVSDSPPASPAAGNPFAYVTPDGVPRVVYRGSDNHIHELRLQGSWIQADLSAIVSDTPPAPPAAGDPYAYVTPDQIPRVVYLGTDGHIHELRLQGSWIQADLTATVSDAPPASPAAGYPFAYVTPDGVPRVIYQEGVLPPTHGLGSNSNYFLDSNCSSLLGVTVIIDVDADISGSDGFGFQLNAYSAKGDTDAAQQYLIYLSPSSDPPQLTCMVDNWTATGKELVNTQVELATLPSHMLPNGYQLQISLQNDSQGNVTSATYTAIDNNGQTIGNQTITVPSTDVAPIVAFQLNFVDYLNGGKTTLSSGSGTIVYSASNQMTVLSTEPSCVDWNYITLETANSTYGIMPAGSSQTFAQSFQAAVGSAAISKAAKRGTIRHRTSRRPI
jgi:hypothetical protein